MTQHEKRSAWHAGMQIDWVGHDDDEGVGARQPQAHGHGRGGGYLYECTTPQVWEDAKLRELADMGMPLIWMEVAQAIGFDAFITMWRLLDAEYERRADAGSMIEIELRRYRSYLRFQRNRFIEGLAPFLDDRTIRDRVADELGEELSLDHVTRLANRRRIGGA
ncbi:MAG: hypothetical protein JNK17_02285 [Hydrogenophaga sp.]|nr:hypothetical protein [Hydrogenophaga sp.]